MIIYQQNNKRFMRVIVLIFFLVWVGSSSSCGGNCPDNSCSNCICGSAKAYIPLDNFCGYSSKWDQNCCKCIATRISAGNTNWMTRYYDSKQRIDFYMIGIMGLYGKNYYDSKDTTECDSYYKDKDLCDPIVTAKCAEAIYLQRGWGRWAVEARYCGCLPASQANNIESKI